MGEEGWVQCSVCGKVHKVEVCNSPEDYLFVEEFCPRCRDETKHLWVGDKEEDLYLYYDPTCDHRYYQYNKTIQND